MAFNLGPGANDRNSTHTNTLYTYIDLNGTAAPSDGLGTSVELFFEGSDGLNVHVGVTAFNPDGYIFTPWGSTSVIATVPAGSKQTYSGLSIAVQTGNQPMIHITGGALSSANGNAAQSYDEGDLVGEGGAHNSTPYNVTLSILIGCVSAAVTTTQAATVITSISVVANGNVTDTGGGITERGFCYSSVNATPTTADSTVHDHTDTTGAYAMTLSSLSPGTLYYIRSYCINGAGTFYGDVVTRKTDYTINFSMLLL